MKIQSSYLGQTDMMGNGSFLDNFILTLTPLGFSVYFVIHWMACQIKVDAHKALIKIAILNDDFNFISFFMPFRLIIKLNKPKNRYVYV